ncbi:MAG: hypothetical protein QOJ75_1095 [Chloroflexota bacterium]|nr:hypothetical protein [Chloroflexota bacterium]
MTTECNPDKLVETAYAVHAGPLVRQLTAITRDGAAAEDLAQEAFVRLVIQLRAGRVPDNIGAWLYRVGQNLAISRGRRMAVARRWNAEIAPGDLAQSPELKAIESETFDSLCIALSELGSTDRAALILAAHGYRGSEIAQSIGRTDAATRTMLCRARTKVRGRLMQAGAG